MFQQPPDPPGLHFWEADSHISKTHHGVKIDVLTGVRGSADLIFNTHVLVTAISGSARYRIAPMATITVEDKEVCSLFLPKGANLIFFETDVECVTITRLPEGIFRHALRGVADYDRMLFRAFRDSTDEVLINASELLRSLVLEANQSRQINVQPLLSGIALRILQRVEGAPHRRARAISPALVALISAHIDKNIARPIKLPELADLVGLSLYHFAREFKLATNTTPMRFVLERRVAAAQRSLITRAPLAEVALDAGFSSQSHFTTAFKLVTGMTPSVWRAAR